MPLSIRLSVLPLLQAILTLSSTSLGVYLVTIWRPGRSRSLPFYSDATHNDPERIILACGENLACMFMPIVSIVEYLHQSSLITWSRQRRLSLPFRTPSNKALVFCNFVVTSITYVFFFITANVPSKYPSTRIHQFAASALILFYALQATFKAVLAWIFFNYERTDSETTNEVELGSLSSKISHTRAAIRSRISGFWRDYHMWLRVTLAVVLWGVLFGTWLCFMGRVMTRTWGAKYNNLRSWMAYTMAMLVHAATISCVTLMVVMSVDMREEKLVLHTESKGC